MSVSVRVLLVDDDVAVTQAMARKLTRFDFVVTPMNSPTEALGYLAEHVDAIDVILLDVDMPVMNGIEVLAKIRHIHRAPPVVMWTADGTAVTATTAMRAGAFTYATKPIHDTDEFIATLRSAAAFGALQRYARELERRVSRAEHTTRLIGESPEMRTLRGRIDKLAASDVTVVIRGESGTGKELVARSLHELGARRKMPFVALNCGATTESLIDSELFGHSKGAFTGAVAARPGLFAEADGGTIFLDEIAELPLSIQARLLRVLQEREIRAVGSESVVAVDVRVIVATHVDLRQAVERKRFREDLYYRLNVSTIEVPPLRSRVSDIPLLVAHLLAKHVGKHHRRVTPAALEALTLYGWPGNVRELENALLHALALASDVAIEDVDLPAAVTATAQRFTAQPASEPRSTTVLTLGEAKKRAIEEFERRYVTAALERAHGNLTHAAQEAGLDRANFRRVLARLGLDSGSFRDREETGPG